MLDLVLQLLLVFAQVSAAPQRCTWGAPESLGVLSSAINESSGAAISRKFPNRSYRINDSGDRGRFFVMDLDGRNATSVTVQGFSPSDVEDLALGRCGDADCLFIGDIGDNSRRKQTIEIVAVRERLSFPGAVPADFRIRARYPDGPHDAESLGVHPDGSIYIITKDPARSQVFKLRADQWRNASTAEIQTLTLVSTIAWARLLPDVSGLARLATSMDIAPDGKKFVVLTYTEAVEFFFDLSAAMPEQALWSAGRDYRRVKLTTLEQQEAIAYMPDGSGLVYDTERPSRNRPARILRVSCAH